MNSESQRIRLLKKAFSNKDWQYLSRHEAFKTLIDEDWTLNDFEALIEVGLLLLKQKEELKDRLSDFAKRKKAPQS